MESKETFLFVGENNAELKLNIELLLQQNIL